MIRDDARADAALRAVSARNTREENITQRAGASSRRVAKMRLRDSGVRRENKNTTIRGRRRLTQQHARTRCRMARMRYGAMALYERRTAVVDVARSRRAAAARPRCTRRSACLRVLCYMNRRPFNTRHSAAPCCPDATLSIIHDAFSRAARERAVFMLWRYAFCASR